MSSMKALKIISKGQAAVQEVPIPKLRPDYLLVKTRFVALNPTDWKHIDKLPQPGATVGCDYRFVSFASICWSDLCLVLDCMIVDQCESS